MQSGVVNGVQLEMGSALGTTLELLVPREPPRPRGFASPPCWLRRLRSTWRSPSFQARDDTFRRRRVVLYVDEAGRAADDPCRRGGDPCRWASDLCRSADDACGHADDTRR